MAAKPLFRIQIVAKAVIKAVTAAVKGLVLTPHGVVETPDGEMMGINDVTPGQPVEGRALVIVRYSMTQGDPERVAPADNTAGKRKVLAQIGDALREKVNDATIAATVRDLFKVDLPTEGARDALADMLAREPERFGVKSIERAGKVLGTATVEHLLADFDGNHWDEMRAGDTLAELVQELNI